MDLDSILKTIKEIAEGGTSAMDWLNKNIFAQTGTIMGVLGKIIDFFKNLFTGDTLSGITDFFKNLFG